MKNIKTKKQNLLIVGIVTLTLIFSFTLIQSSLQQEKKLIIGTWINIDKPFDTLVFTKTNMHFQFKNLQDTLKFKYVISKDPLSCKKYNPLFEIENYLFLFSGKKMRDTLCYEVLFNKLNTNELGIRYLPLEKGAYDFFRRQE